MPLYSCKLTEATCRPRMHAYGTILTEDSIPTYILLSATCEPILLCYSHRLAAVGLHSHSIRFLPRSISIHRSPRHLASAQGRGTCLLRRKAPMREGPPRSSCCSNQTISCSRSGGLPDISRCHGQYAVLLNLPTYSSIRVSNM